MASKLNIISDISTILRLPNKVMDELVAKANLCIGSIISDAKKQGESAISIEIGIGTLSINLVDMQCKFTPSKALKSTISKCLTNGYDPLELYLEEALAAKLISTCEEVI